MIKNLFLLFFLLLGGNFTFGQLQKSQNAVEIYNKIEKMNFLGTILYVAAHPDDENTSLISYFSNEIHARVGYISLTRGDGGQNLIGSEINELLGVIRTQELLSARKIDGGHQFFSRANDFGYSKNPDETFDFWNKDEVLNDLVYVIRKFQPDIIINRFDHRTQGTTHGHHTASAMLSMEAFDLSNSKTDFIEQFKSVGTWQAQRLFFNTNWWFFGSEDKFNETDKSKYLVIDVGNYYPELGLSNTEISALSRSQHKSQGFGIAGKRGEDLNYLELIKGGFNFQSESIFDGINTSWTRIKGGKEIGDILEKVQQNFDFKAPEKSLPELMKAYEKIKNLENKHWREIKSEEIKEIIVACSGLYLQAFTTEKLFTPGQQIEVNLETINRSDYDIYLEEINLFNTPETESTFKPVFPNLNLKNNEVFQAKVDLTLSKNIPLTSPYWLKVPHSIGMYEVENSNYIGLPKTPTQIKAIFNLKINEIPIQFERDLVYKIASPSSGEVVKPIAVVPAVSLSMQNKTLVFPDENAKYISVEITAFKDDVSGKITLERPAIWEVSPEYFEVDLLKKGEQKTVTFTVKPPKDPIVTELKPVFEINNEKFTRQLHTINYEHIDEQVVLLPAVTKLIRADIQIKGNNVCYITGAGDNIPQSLREIGYNVSEILPNDITLEKLQKFNSVILGIRAYDLDNDLVLHQNTLFEYVKQGGTLINQYNSIKELRTQKLAPYDLELSHNRVTDENSEVRFLAPDHDVLNKPNKISQDDFKHWIQERGLYFPNKWGKEFTPILGMNDEGEKEMQGGLLVAKYGKGYFIYTGLSFFRELPAGVPGAYRLFANLLSLGN